MAVAFWYIHVMMIAPSKGLSLLVEPGGIVSPKLVELRENPAHRRSPLLALTGDGKAAFAEMDFFDSHTILRDLRNCVRGYVPQKRPALVSRARAPGAQKPTPRHETDARAGHRTKRPPAS